MCVILFKLKQKIDRFPKNQIQKKSSHRNKKNKYNIKSSKVWKNGKSRAWKIFIVKTLLLINQLISSNICKSKFPRLQCKKRDILLPHRKKFREINLLVISLVKTLLSRNFCQKSVRENFRKFHTTAAVEIVWILWFFYSKNFVKPP